MKVNVITEDGKFKTFYNELDEVKENLDYILSVKEQRIKSLEKENSELKNNEYYRKLRDENKALCYNLYKSRGKKAEVTL